MAYVPVPKDLTRVKTKVMFNKAYRKEYQIHRNRVENTSPNLVLPLFTSKHLLLLLFQHFRFHR